MNEEAREQRIGNVVAEIAGSPVEDSSAGEDASVDRAADGLAARLDDLERRIRELEAAIGDLRTVNASAASQPAGRRTQAPYASRLVAKGAEPVGAGAVDAALGSLSVEQRIAVKSGLLRAGLL